MKTRKLFPIGILLLVISVLCMEGCTSTQLISSWSEPALSIQSFHKILVVGIMGDKDVELRQDMEMNMVNALAAQGIHAYSSYVILGPQGFVEKDARSAILDLKDKTFDAVMCMVLTDKDKQQYYNPPTTTTVPINQNYYNNGYSYNNTSSYYNNGGYYNGGGFYNNGGYYNNYNGMSNYYNQAYRTVTTPGYYTTTVNYSIETDLFDFPKDSLIYYAETKTYNPSSVYNMSKEVTKDIITDMVNKRILPYTKPKSNW
jgi:hypothetical protein